MKKLVLMCMATYSLVAMNSDDSKGQDCIIDHLREYVDRENCKRMIDTQILPVQIALVDEKLIVDSKNYTDEHGNSFPPAPACALFSRDGKNVLVLDGKRENAKLHINPICNPSTLESVTAEPREIVVTGSAERIVAWDYNKQGDQMMFLIHDDQSIFSSSLISYIKKIGITDGSVIISCTRRFPPHVTKIAYDHKKNRIFGAGFSINCMKPDFVDLFVVDGQTEKLKSICTETCLRQNFCHMRVRSQGDLITAQDSGTVAQWDFSNNTTVTKEIFKFPLDARYDQILPANHIYIDLSQDEERLLIGFSQPYSRIILHNLNTGQREFDFLDLADSRPLTNIKLLPNNTQFIAVRAALQKNKTPWQKEQPRESALQLWQNYRAGDIDISSTLLAELVIANSCNACCSHKTIDISPDGSQLLHNHCWWHIKSFATIRERLLKDAKKAKEMIEKYAPDGEPLTNVQKLELIGELHLQDVKSAHVE